MKIVDWIIVGFVVVFCLEALATRFHRSRCPLPKCGNCGKPPCQCNCPGDCAKCGARQGGNDVRPN